MTGQEYADWWNSTTELAGGGRVPTADFLKLDPTVQGLLKQYSPDVVNTVIGQLNSQAQRQRDEALAAQAKAQKEWEDARFAMFSSASANLQAYPDVLKGLQDLNAQGQALAQRRQAAEAGQLDLSPEELQALNDQIEEIQKEIEAYIWGASLLPPPKATAASAQPVGQWTVTFADGTTQVFATQAEAQSALQQDQQRQAAWATVVQDLQAALPSEDAYALITQLQEDQAAFETKLREAGRSPETEAVLKMLVPDITEHDIEQFFLPPQKQEQFIVTFADGTSVSFPDEGQATAFLRDIWPNQPTEAQKLSAQQVADTVAYFDQMFAKENLRAGKLNVDDAAALARAMTELNLRFTGGSQVTAWRTMDDELKREVVGLYLQDPFRKNTFTSIVADINSIASTGFVQGLVVAMPSAILTPLAKQMVGLPVSKWEWGVAGTQLVLLFAGPMGKVVTGAIGKALQVGILGAGAVAVTGYTVDNWNDMSPTEQKVSVGFDLLMVLGLVLAARAPIRPGRIAAAKESVIASVGDSPELRAALDMQIEGMAKGDAALIREAGRRMQQAAQAMTESETAATLASRGKILEANADELVKATRPRPAQPVVDALTNAAGKDELFIKKAAIDAERAAAEIDPQIQKLTESAAAKGAVPAGAAPVDTLVSWNESVPVGLQDIGIGIGPDGVYATKTVHGVRDTGITRQGVTRQDSIEMSANQKQQYANADKLPDAERNTIQTKIARELMDVENKNIKARAAAPAPAQPIPKGILTMEGAKPPPPPKPQSITFPKPRPQVPRNAEATRIIVQSTEQVRQDMPGTLTRLGLKIPGVKQLMTFERPGLKMVGEKQKVLIAMVSENAARSDVATRALATRLDILNRVRKVFGKSAVHGGQVKDVKFIGTAEQAKNPITGTLKDIADNPELYELTKEQTALLADMEARNNALLSLVTDKYAADIGRFEPKKGGAYLPNVDTPEDVIEYIGNETLAAATGRGKTRVWPTARDRMGGKTPFKPVLDVQKLIEGLDDFKAGAAGGQTFREALGGLTRLEAMAETHPELYARMTGLRKQLTSLRSSLATLNENAANAIDEFLSSPVEDADLGALRDGLEVKLQTGPRVGMDAAAIQSQIDAVRADIAELRPAWKAANLKPYVFVQQGIYRYFPSDIAKLVVESRKVNKNPVWSFIENWRGQAFSGDASPFAIQGTIGVLADPFGSLTAAGGGVKNAVLHHDLFRSMRVEALVDDVANNLDDWSQYASLMGRKLSGTPAEYAAGFLSKIPGFDKFTESTYVTVTRGSFNLWQRTYRSQVRAGVPELVAKVAAANAAGKIYPLAQAARLGQSAARATVLRALPTSYSFIRQPATLMADAVKGYAKLATLQKLTPQESLAVKLVSTMAASTLAVSATSAAIEAMRKGEDVQKAIWDAVNPNPFNGKFASIIVAGKRIPLGGPFRAIFRAVYPQQVEGIPFPVPFAGLPTYLKNRINPVLSTQLDLVLNRDYSKTQIVKGKFPENILRGLEYEFEGSLPLTAGAAAEAIRQGDRYKEQLWQQVISQFMGVNMVTLDNTYLQRQIRQLGLPIEDWEPKPFSIQQQPVYTTANLWSDAGRVLSARTGPGYDDSELVKAIIRGRTFAELMNAKFNESLININADPQKGDTFYQLYMADKISQADFILLREYHAITDEQKQADFRKEHPEIYFNPRAEWLQAHPSENALLAVFGQAKILTQKAYDEAWKLVKQLDIPERALPPNTFIPKAFAADYFAYQDILNKFDDQSPEAKIIIARADERTGGAMSKFLNRQPVETPIPALALQVKNRKLDDEYAAKTTDGEREIFRDLRPEWKADNRRIEAFKNKGDQFAELWVDHGKKADEFGPSSPEAKLFLVDHSEVHKWAIKQELLTDDGKEWNIPVLRINAKYRAEDKSYDAIDAKAKNSDGVLLRDAFLQDPKNAAYAKARIERNGYELGLADVTQWTEYNKLPEYGAWRDRYRKEHPEFDAAVMAAKIRKGETPWTTLDPSKVPLEQYDKIYEEFKKQFKAWENITGTEMEKAAKRREIFDSDPAFKEAYYAREAYGKMISETRMGVDVNGKPASFFDLYVEYHLAPDKGYARERILLANPEFAKLLEVDVPKRLPDVQYDVLTAQYAAQFEEIEGMSNEESRYFLADPEKRAAKARELRFQFVTPQGIVRYTDFGIAEIMREARLKYVPDKYIADYVKYHKMIGEKEETNARLKEKFKEEEEKYKALTTDRDREIFLESQAHAEYASYRRQDALTDYEDDWYLLEHPEYYKDVYQGLQGNQARDFDKVPPREVFAKYIIYYGKPEGVAREEMRRKNPDLDAWMFLTGKVSKLIGAPSVKGPTLASKIVWEKYIYYLRILRERPEDVGPYLADNQDLEKWLRRNGLLQ